MTTTIHRRTRTQIPAWLFAVGGAALAGILTAIGTMGGGDTDNPDGTDWLLINLPVIAVSTALIFGLVLPRVLRSSDPTVGALVLGVAAVASCLVFYLGLPSILSFAAAATVLAPPGTKQSRVRAAAALALGAAAVAFAVALAFTG